MKLSLHKKIYKIRIYLRVFLKFFVGIFAIIHIVMVTYKVVTMATLSMR